MPNYCKPQSVKIRASSRYSLASAAFDVVNYRNGLSPGGLPNNLTLTADTPNGVLSGSVACISVGSNDYEATFASYNTPPGGILGIFATGAAGNPFDNNQAAAGGVIAIYMGDGDMITYVFETNTPESGYASIIANYTYGALLYVSPFGLLTTVQPSSMSSYSTSPHNNVVGTVTKQPTTTDLSLGFRLYATPATVAAYT